jgi:hypothetical protein
MARHIDPQHRETRTFLRIIGVGIVIIGGLFTIVGFGSFFSSFAGFHSSVGGFRSPEPPRLFWCAFIGLPLLGLGTMICKFAFMGAVGRYMANEVAPVGKDVINYMADGTKDSIRDVASAVGEGLRAGAPAGQVQVMRCHKCNEDNEAAANFCNACGAPLTKSKGCPGCGELNDPDAHFCDNCGKAMS